MPSLVIPGAFDNALFKNAFYAILFGVLSGMLSTVGLDDMNLREIPLLICLIHIDTFAYIFLLSLFTLINAPQEIPLWAVYLVHLVPLLVAWLSIKFVDKKKLSIVFLGLASVIITVGYYLFLLLPLVVIATEVFASAGKNFIDVYLDLLPLSSFEIISSSLVVSFYLMQFEIRKALVHNNKNLALIVEARTSELISANKELLTLNEELKASNESIKELNGNLEQLVTERTNKINDQLNQLSKYAHMNSHELRAPLARMLGLMQLIRHERVSADQKGELLDMLYDSSIELDNIIKEMNRLLEKEILFKGK